MLRERNKLDISATFGTNSIEFILFRIIVIAHKETQHNRDKIDNVNTDSWTSM